MKTILFILCLLLSALAASPVIAAPSISVVHVEGAELKNFLGKEISKMNLQVFRAGKWLPLPFQIDEKAYDPIAGTRRWALEKALSRRTELSPGNGMLDKDEVLLFLAKDLGEKAAPASSTENPVAEIQMGTGYAYLFFDPKTPLVSSESYVRYDPAQDAVSALGYDNRFDPAHSILQEQMVPKNQRSGEPADILDRFKVRVVLAIKHFFDVSVEEENITSKRIGYRVGPIRVIRRVAAYKSLGPIRVTPKSESDFLFYPYFVQVPSKLDNPLDGRSALESKSKGFAGFDFTQFFHGSRFYSEKNPKPVLIDGKMSAEEEALVRQDVNWWAVTGEKGSLIVDVQWDPDLTKAGVTCDLYYRDDRTAANPPEKDPGESTVGFQLDLTRIPAGRYTIYVKQIFPPEPLVPGLERTILAQARPPAVTVNSL